MTPGLFTTLRVAAGEAWLWPDHLRRLREGAAALGLPVPDGGACLREVAAAVDALPDARVRITVTREGTEVEARPYTPPADPWRLAPVTVSYPGDAPLLKTTDRARYDEARRRAGDHDDALLVSPDGSVLETSVANVLFLTGGGRVVTPPPSGILPGIARARALEALRDLGFETAEAPLGLREAATAAACVVTNALFLAHGVAEIRGAASYDSAGLARDLREAVIRKAPQIRIIQR